MLRQQCRGVRRVACNGMMLRPFAQFKILFTTKPGVLKRSRARKQVGMKRTHSTTPPLPRRAGLAVADSDLRNCFS
jgi:hypothetical protein